MAKRLHLTITDDQDIWLEKLSEQTGEGKYYLVRHAIHDFLVSQAELLGWDKSKINSEVDLDIQ